MHLAVFIEGQKVTIGSDDLTGFPLSISTSTSTAFCFVPAYWRHGIPAMSKPLHEAMGYPPKAVIRK